MAAVISNIPGRGYSPNLETRDKRRAVVRRILSQLEEILGNEQNYRDNIPENLRDSEVFHMAEYHVELLEEAIEALELAYIAK